MIDPPPHPGALLQQTLDAIGMSQAELARQTRLTTKHVNQVCQGEAGISARSAVLLEESTGVEAGLWLRIQVAHDLATARTARLDELTAEREKRVAAAAAVADLVRQIEPDNQTYDITAGKSN
jgi:addiction module HigA family antidote